MQIEPTDIALFLISAAACLYCMALSRRLKALQNTKNGLGATIVAFSESMASLSASTNDTRLKVAQLAKNLPPLIEDAERACEKIEAFKQELTAHREATIKDMETSSEEVQQSLKHMMSNAQDRILEFKQVNNDLIRNTTILKGAVRDAELQRKAPKSSVREPMATEHDLF